MEQKYLSPGLVEFFKNSPNLFVRCDRDGKENPQGEFWRACDEPSQKSRR
jgi:hypothetical protein